VTALGAIGMRFRPLDSTIASGSGLLCFASVDRDLLHSLADTACNNHARVIAVHISSTPLASAVAWSVVQAGASDVLEGASLRDLAAQIKARFDPISR
jgi:hypothetical protein